MPWLNYDINLDAGDEMVFPAHQIIFKSESWKAVRSESEKMRLVENSSTTKGGVL
jgi:hypothetical protein